jgi:hypothetical protein
VKALQPQRELSLPADFLIGAKETCELQINARIFADTLPEPVTQKLTIQISAKKFVITAADLKILVEPATDEKPTQAKHSTGRAKKPRHSS